MSGIAALAAVGPQDIILLGDYVAVVGQVGMVGHLSISDKATLTTLTGNLPSGEIYSDNPAQPTQEGGGSKPPNAQPGTPSPATPAESTAPVPDLPLPAAENHS